MKPSTKMTPLGCFFFQLACQAWSGSGVDSSETLSTIPPQPPGIVVQDDFGHAFTHAIFRPLGEPTSLCRADQTPWISGGEPKTDTVLESVVVCLPPIFSTANTAIYIRTQFEYRDKYGPRKPPLFNVINTQSGGSHWSGGGSAYVTMARMDKNGKPTVFRIEGSLTLGPSLGLSGINMAGTDEHYVARRVSISGEARLTE